MIGRSKYRKPRFKPFKPAMRARFPRLMLTVGLILSLGIHLGLGVALRDRPVGTFDPEAMNEVSEPVRVKRAQFDQILTPGETEGAGEEEPESAESLAETLMDEVQTQTSAPLDVDLEMRQVPEPLPRMAEAEPIATPEIDFDQLLSSAIPEPEAPQFDDTSRFDVETTGPGSAELSGDLLTELSSPDGGMPSVGDAGGGSGPLAGGGGAGGVPTSGDGMGRGGGGSGGVGTGLAGDGGGMDFMQFGQIEPADFEPPEHLDNDFDYEVTTFQPRGGDAGYFRVRLTGKRSLRKLETMAKDVIFMVDTSRSIDDRTIREIGGAISQTIRAMNPDDRFNLVFFSDDVTFFATKPVKPTDDYAEAADRWLRSARARGYTDVNLALRQLLVRDLEPGRVYELILISDGRPTMGVLDTRELINLITRENDLAASIYAVGIGRKQDQRLLDFLAYRNKGFSISSPSRREVQGDMLQLMSRLRYPIIADVQVRFAGAGMDQVYPLTLPNVHQGESFEIFGRFDEPGPFTVQVTGRSVGQPVDVTLRSDLTDAKPGGSEIAQGWAFWKLHHLYSEIIRLGEREELLKQINLLRQRYDLETLY